MGNRIIAVSSAYPPEALGGFERSCAASVARLAAAGHDVHVLTGRSATRRDDGVHRDLPLHHGDFGRPLTRVREGVWHERSRRVAASVASPRPDVVTLWATSWISRAALTAVARTAPTVAVVFDYALLEHLTAPRLVPRAGLKAPYDRAAAVWLRRTGADGPIPPPDHFVFCSKAIRETYEARLGPLPADVVYHGVPVPDVQPALPGRGGPLLVGAVGRLVAEKGFHVLVEAAAQLARDGEGDMIAVEIRGTAPDPAYHADLCSAAAAARREGVQVEVGGPLASPEAVTQWMLGKHCIANPATWAEPFALVPLEAMAAGRPLVSTATGGSAELVDDGINSLVVRPGDAADMAAALRRLATDSALAERLATAGFGRVSRDHRIEVRGPELDMLLLAPARPA